LAIRPAGRTTEIAFFIFLLLPISILREITFFLLMPSSIQPAGRLADIKANCVYISTYANQHKAGRPILTISLLPVYSLSAGWLCTALQVLNTASQEFVRPAGAGYFIAILEFTTWYTYHWHACILVEARGEIGNGHKTLLVIDNMKLSGMTHHHCEAAIDLTQLQDFGPFMKQWKRFI